MKGSFLGTFTIGLMIVGLMSFTDPYQPQIQDTQKQSIQKQDSQRRSNRLRTDTPSDTRLNRNTKPGMPVTDSIPVPPPRPPVPSPDSSLNKHMR